MSEGGRERKREKELTSRRRRRRRHCWSHVDRRHRARCRARPAPPAAWERLPATPPARSDPSIGCSFVGSHPGCSACGCSCLLLLRLQLGQPGLRLHLDGKCSFGSVFGSGGNEGRRERERGKGGRRPFFNGRWTQRSATTGEGGTHAKSKPYLHTLLLLSLLLLLPHTQNARTHTHTRKG